MSNATLNAALKRPGFDTDTIQPHGFRHTASTALHELGFAADTIEEQLSHRKSGVAGVYNKAKHARALEAHAGMGGPLGQSALRRGRGPNQAVTRIVWIL